MWKPFAVDLDIKYLEMFSIPRRHCCGPFEAEHTKRYQAHFVNPHNVRRATPSLLYGSSPCICNSILFIFRAGSPHDTFHHPKKAHQNKVCDWSYVENVFLSFYSVEPVTCMPLAHATITNITQVKKRHSVHLPPCYTCILKYNNW